MRDKGIVVPRPQTTKMLPTKTHMAIVQLQNQGIIKYLVSQNTDGLHRKSGIRYDMISELHGNTNRERCRTCSKEYLRDFSVRNQKNPKDHITGRLCTVPGCNGELEDTIVNFGESLPEKALQKAMDHSEIADLCIVLGSSCKVTPAANIPKRVAKRGGKLVILNLQKTPLDDLATLKIHTTCDQFMEEVMRHLEIEIPPFILNRRLRVTKNDENLLIQGVDQDGTPFEFLKSIKIEFENDEESRYISGENSVIFQYPLNGRRGNLKITLKTMQYHKEGNYSLVHHVNDENKTTQYLCKWNSDEKSWSHVEEDISNLEQPSTIWNKITNMINYLTN